MADELELSGCRVDLHARVVHRASGDVHLTPIEAKLLTYLRDRGGAAVGRDELLREVWGWRSTQTRAVATAIWRLREKIEAVPKEPAHLLTVPGGEYRLVLPERLAPLPHVPGDLGPFVGRADLLDSIRATLAERRLVTLVGPGGAGKTRTAMEVARSSASSRLVDLSGCLGAESVAATIAAALGWDEPMSPEALAHGLREATVDLVVLDNAEVAVAEVAGEVARALSEGGPRLVVTSREPLKLGAEQVVRLGGLEPAEALALWRLRAPEAADHPRTGELLDALDRLPLAIELAAAWVPLLSVDDLLRRLGARPLDLLSSERRDRPPRHATLRAVVSASWDLLDAADRELLAGVCCFARGPTPDEAEAVLGGPEALLLLRRLCDRSVARVVDGRVVPWHAVRAFVLQQTSPTEVPARHAAWFARFGQPEVLRVVEHGTDPEVVRRIVDARPELLRAARVALDCGWVELAVGCARAIASVARWRGPRAEVEVLLADVPAPLHADRASLLRLMGRHEDALVVIEAGLTGHPEPPVRARLLRLRGLLRSDRGDPTGARADLTSAVALAREVGDAAAEGLALGNLAFLDWLEGDRTNAEVGTLGALERLRSVDHRRAEAQLLGNLAAMRSEGGEDATALFERALALHRALGNRQSEVTLRLAWAGALQDRGQLEASREQHAEALALARDLGSPHVEARCAVNAGALEVTLAEDDEAAERLLRDALPALRSAGDRRFEAVALINLAVLAERRGDPGAAALRERAATLAQSVGDTIVERSVRRE